MPTILTVPQIIYGTILRPQSPVPGGLSPALVQRATCLLPRWVPFCCLYATLLLVAALCTLHVTRCDEPAGRISRGRWSTGLLSHRLQACSFVRAFPNTTWSEKLECSSATRRSTTRRKEVWLPSSAMPRQFFLQKLIPSHGARRFVLTHRPSFSLFGLQPGGQHPRCHGSSSLGATGSATVTVPASGPLWMH